MKKEKSYIQINKDSWNARTISHIKSDFYHNESFIAGRCSLNTFELDLLGDIKGKKILHLQCHFGQDSISLARRGAKVTGVDLSNQAIDAAINLAQQTNQDVKFICCNIYDLHNHLDEEFDIVFTSYGTIGWLPDLQKWASIISRYLKNNGQFIFIEFHPFIWMYDDDFTQIKYKYSDQNPIIETEEGSYAEKNSNTSHKSVTWNHGIGYVINSLIQNSMVINSLLEYDYSPYGIFNDSKEFENGKYRISKFGDKFPLVYSISATKKK